MNPIVRTERNKIIYSYLVPVISEQKPVQWLFIPAASVFLAITVKTRWQACSLNIFMEILKYQISTSLAAPGVLARFPTGSGKVIGYSNQLSLNKFFDLSTSSMRKGRDRVKTGGETWKKKRK